MLLLDCLSKVSSLNRTLDPNLSKRAKLFPLSAESSK